MQILTNGVRGIVQLVFVVTTSFLVALLYLSFATVTSKVAPGAKVLKQIIPSSSLKNGFCNKSFQKDEPLTSWTLFQHICPHFWVGLLGAIANPPKSEEKYVEKVFNWSEVHLSDMNCYKIHTLVDITGPPFCEKKKVTPVTLDLVGTSVTLTQTV